jgi:hypothetical protein
MKNKKRKELGAAPLLRLNCRLSLITFLFAWFFVCVHVLRLLLFPSPIARLQQFLSMDALESEDAALSPLQRIASGKEADLFRILNEAAAKSKPRPKHHTSMEAYLGRPAAHLTPPAAGVPQLAHVGKEDLDAPCSWLCGKCTERAVGRYCHNCGTECFLASPPRTSRR